jgi:hypothetical protein
LKLGSVVGCVIVALGTIGCPPATYKYTQKTNVTASKREPNCSFELYPSCPPNRPYDAIGILDLAPGLTRAPSDPKTFMNTVRDKVCEVGGDGVLVEVNEFGQYMRGTVIRFRDKAASADSK